MKLYDKEINRVVVFGEKADTEYWDSHWRINDFTEKVKSGKNNKMIKNFTSKFLPTGSKILEGGCGIGQNVYGLLSWGYDVYGVDSAQDTINSITREFPDLNVSVQDVRKLDFPDNFFDGYWSLGVIEHFWRGYDDILKEAKRVIKPGGYLFLTFPYMSHLRILKAKLGLYEELQNNVDNFYQFILDEKQVRVDVESYGFRLVSRFPHDATKGMKDEISILKPILQKIYDGENIIMKGMNFLLLCLFSGFASHVILLVFQKNGKNFL